MRRKVARGLWYSSFNLPHRPNQRRGPPEGAWLGFNDLIVGRYEAAGHQTGSAEVAKDRPERLTRQTERCLSRIRRLPPESPRFIDQTDVVAAEMESAIKQWPKFPMALFKRCLNKIQNILTGALEMKELLGTTQNLQATEPGTLKQSLRGLL